MLTGLTVHESQWLVLTSPAGAPREGCEMAKIVGVHGVGNQFKGENSVRAEWLPAIEDGLARARRPISLGDDFACAFYGYLFRPTGKAAIDPPLDATDIKSDWERELLEL